MDNFPGNSRSKPVEKTVPEKNIEKITTGAVTKRKVPLGKKFMSIFSGREGIWAYIALDILLPAAKDAIADSVSQGTEKALFGESRSLSRRGRRGSNGYVAYNRMGQGALPTRDGYREESRQLSRRNRATHNFEEIILETRGEAEQVVDALFELISKYEAATVEDLYELVGIPSEYTDKKWGWTDLRGAGVTRIRGGYLLDVPKPDPLD